MESTSLTYCEYCDMLHHAAPFYAAFVWHKTFGPWIPLLYYILNITNDIKTKLHRLIHMRLVALHKSSTMMVTVFFLNRLDDLPTLFYMMKPLVSEHKSHYKFFLSISVNFSSLSMQVHSSCKEDSFCCGTQFHHGYLLGRPCCGIRRNPISVNYCKQQTRKCLQSKGRGHL